MSASTNIKTEETKHTGEMEGPKGAEGAEENAFADEMDLMCCLKCEKPQSRLLRCTRCNIALYCSGICQAYDWEDHKQRCLAFAASHGKKDLRTILVHNCSTQDCRDTGGVVFSPPAITTCLALSAEEHMRQLGDPTDGFVILRRDFESRKTNIFFEGRKDAAGGVAYAHIRDHYPALFTIYNNNLTAAPLDRKHLALVICTKNDDHRFVTTLFEASSRFKSSA